jgi:HK97 family phage portal protein
MNVVGGPPVFEGAALGLTAFYRAIALTAGTIAGLPIRSYAIQGEQRVTIPSLFDDPAGPYGFPRFNWLETLCIHLLIHSEAYLAHIVNAGGELIGLWPIHPMAVQRVAWSGYSKVFHVQMADGLIHTYTNDPTADPATQMTQILGMSVDGLRGLSPLSLFRRTLQTGLSGEVAANRVFTNGMHLGGIVVPEVDISEEDAKAVKAQLNAKTAGAENAGDIAVINKNFKFTQWSMSLEDAQFLQSREFQVVEISRMFGIPTSLLMANEKSTSWGTGIKELIEAWQKFGLSGWTNRLEQAFSQLMPPLCGTEFDFHALLAGTPADEVNLILTQYAAGLLTWEEARTMLGRDSDPTKKPAVPPMVPPAPKVGLKISDEEQ